MERRNMQGGTATTWVNATQFWDGDTAAADLKCARCTSEFNVSETRTVRERAAEHAATQCDATPLQHRRRRRTDAAAAVGGGGES